MNPYREANARLAPLETFDPNVFVSDAEFPPEMCHFVLALAVVYNDLRDLMVAYMCLEPILPPMNTGPTPAVGNVMGVSVHLMRSFAGVLHEAFELIRSNSDVVESAKFKQIVSNLHPEARESWLALAAVAEGKAISSPLTKMLLFARNKVAFHYDPKEIARGFRLAFIGTGREPYVSRGQSMAEARFYFADAAVSEYMNIAGDTAAAGDFMKARTQVFHQVNHALREIVFGFVVKRRAGWRQPSVSAPTT